MTTISIIHLNFCHCLLEKPTPLPSLFQRQVNKLYLLRVVGAWVDGRGRVVGFFVVDSAWEVVGSSAIYRNKTYIWIEYG